jgi:hypothetical protein
MGNVQTKGSTHSDRLVCSLLLWAHLTRFDFTAASRLAGGGFASTLLSRARAWRPTPEIEGHHSIVPFQIIDNALVVVPLPNQPSIPSSSAISTRHHGQKGVSMEEAEEEGRRGQGLVGEAEEATQTRV